MLKTLILTAAIITYAPSAYAACAGYQNNITALEAVMAQHQNANPQHSKPTPPIASINQSLTALEKAVKTHRAAKPPKNPTK
jgi:hypothetical protein